MDYAKMKTMALVMILAVVGGKSLIREVSGNLAVVRREFCLNNCMTGCKGTGVSALRCFTYCERHCDSHEAREPHEASATVQKTAPNLHYHYCKLGCMLDKCSQFSQDEAKQESCVEQCEQSSCLEE